MRDSARKPLGWSARRRPFGDSFAGCLLTCIVVIGGVVWAYFHFFQNRDLDNPLTGHNIGGTMTSEVVNTYRVKMIRDIFSRAEGASKRISALYKDVKDNKISPDDFKQEATEIERELRDTMTELKARSVPKQFEKPHLQLAEGIGEWWKCLNALRDAQVAEEANIREAKMEEAKNTYAKGRKLFDQSRPKYGKV